MKKINIIIFITLFFISCIDLITEEEYYESIYLKQSGWLEFYQDNVGEDIQIADNFSFQIWFSGQELIEFDAPCLLTIDDDEWSLNLYRNPNINNLISIYLNQELSGEIEIENINLDDESNFYLLSVIIDNQLLTIYFNEFQIYQNTINNVNTPKIVVGANSIDDSLSNLWYGYIDEVRLWNQSLPDSIINFHNEYKYKVSSSYNDEYLENLIGLWDFRVNTEGENPSNIFQDINNYNTFSIIYNLGVASSELSKNGR